MTKTTKPKRPRLRGARHTYQPLDLTDFIGKMHAASTMMTIKPKTTGAFGGCSRIERRSRAVVKSANPANSPI